MDDQYHPVAMSETGRTEAFSDGVLAIAVTLLVLDLHVPPRNALHEPLAVALAQEWPAYAAYVTSFLIIGIIWVNHHAVFGLVGRVDRGVLFLNLLLLMSVVAIPFATALLSEYLLAGNGAARRRRGPRRGARIHRAVQCRRHWTICRDARHCRG
jgi:TMEM175 potassium channel family protein